MRTNFTIQENKNIINATNRIKKMFDEKNMKGQI